MYVCGTAKAEDCGNGSKRDENNDGMTLDDFVEKINAHVKERREALNSEESNDDEFRQTLDEDDAELTKEEVIAVRLYSGPAYQPINEFLRQVGKLTGDYRQIIANSPKVTLRRRWGISAAPSESSPLWPSFQTLTQQQVNAMFTVACEVRSPSHLGARMRAAGWWRRTWASCPLHAIGRFPCRS